MGIGVWLDMSGVKNQAKPEPADSEQQIASELEAECSSADATTAEAGA